MEINWNFIIVDFIYAIVGGFLAGFISGLIIKFYVKTNFEKSFEKNTINAYTSLFDHVELIDYKKQDLYIYLERIGIPSTFGTVQFTDNVIKKIQITRKFLRIELDKLTFYNNSPFVIAKDYALIQQYCLGGLEFLSSVNEKDFTAWYDTKILEFHKFYAKEIISTFKIKPPQTFIDKWENEFIKWGGIENIKKPEFKSGIISRSYNYNNEALYYDANYSSIIKELREIKKLFQDTQ